MRKCTGCGKCCLNEQYMGTLDTTAEDIARWHEEGREDNLQWESLSDLWIHPTTGEEVVRCPFLRKLPNQQKYKCRIHATKQSACGDYPQSIEQMKRDGYEMLEPHDYARDESELMAELNRLRAGCTQQPRPPLPSRSTRQ